MAIALRYCGFGAPNNCLAVAAIVVLALARPFFTFDESCVQFDVTIVMSSSSTSAVALIVWVGSEALA